MTHNAGQLSNPTDLATSWVWSCHSLSLGVWGLVQMNGHSLVAGSQTGEKWNPQAGAEPPLGMAQQNWGRGGWTSHLDLPQQALL